MPLEANLPNYGKIYTFPYTPSEDGLRLPVYLSTFGHFSYDQTYYTKRKDYDTYLILYTLSGKGLLRYKGQESILREGDFAIFDCIPPHFYKSEHEAWNFKWIHLKGSFIKEVEKRINGDGLNVINISPSKLNPLFDQIHTLLVSNSLAFDLYFNNIVTNMLTEILIESDKQIATKIPKKKHDLVNRFIDLTRSDYSNQICIQDFCNNNNESLYRFIRLFKSLTGFTPYAFLTNYRINQAKYLLLNSNQPIELIATFVGYENANVFIRNFKKHTHQTPKNYRLNNL